MLSALVDHQISTSVPTSVSSPNEYVQLPMQGSSSDTQPIQTTADMFSMFNNSPSMPVQEQGYSPQKTAADLLEESSATPELTNTVEDDELPEGYKKTKILTY